MGIDEDIIFDDDRVGLQWFQNIVDVNIVGDVNLFVDLCIGIDCGLGVDYCVFIDIGVEIDIGWYQDCVWCDEGILVYGIGWNGMEVGCFEFFFVLVFKFGWDFVLLFVGCDVVIYQIYWVEVEVEQDGFFELLMYDLVVIVFF